jgi:hypothetical protein
MFYKRAVLGLAAALAFSAAHASVPMASGPGAIDLSDGSESFSAFSNTGPATYTFSLGTGFTYDLGLSFFSLFGPVSVSSIALSGPTASTLSPSAGTASFTGLAAGSYSLTFNFAPSTGLFAGTANVTATPVPEAEATILALAGMGVAGLMAARRRRAA